MPSGASSSLRLGFVGCGRATESLHLPALRTVPGVSVVALSDVDAGRLRRAADRFGIPGRHADFASLLADDSVDAVGVCVPASLHADIAIAALEAGKHVLVEKPLALTLDDARRMVDRAAGTRLVSAVGFNLRCHRLVDQARRIIEAGQLGDIEVIRSTWTSGFHRGYEMPAWRERRAFGGGALQEVAVHHVDLWRYLSGAEVVRVFADTRSQLVEDQTAVVAARLSNGALVTAGFCERTADSNQIEICGQKARLAFSIYRADSLSVQPIADIAGGIRVRLKEATHRLAAVPALLRAAGAGGDFRQSYRREWQRFVGAVRGDVAVPATFGDGYRAVQVVRAMLESSELGSPVAVGTAPHEVAHG